MLTTNILEPNVLSNKKMHFCKVFKIILKIIHCCNVLSLCPNKDKILNGTGD